MTGPLAPKVVAAKGGGLCSLRSRGDSPTGLRVVDYYWTRPLGVRVQKVLRLMGAKGSEV